MKKEFSSEEEFDEEFDRIEEINREYLDMKEEITHADYNVMISEQELSDNKEHLETLRVDLYHFEQKYKDILI